jgi:hypothetical protein
MNQVTIQVRIRSSLFPDKIIDKEKEANDAQLDVLDHLFESNDKERVVYKLVRLTVVKDRETSLILEILIGRNFVVQTSCSV